MKKLLLMMSVLCAFPALAATNADLRDMYDIHEENELAFRKQYGNRELVFDAVVRSVDADAAIRMSPDGFDFIEMAGANIDAPGTYEGIFPMAVAVFANEDDLIPLRHNQQVRLKCVLDFDMVDMLGGIYFDRCIIVDE